MLVSVYASYPMCGASLATAAMGRPMDQTVEATLQSAQHRAGRARRCLFVRAMQI